MYPFYDKAVKSGITTICIHKGLLPPDYEKSYAGVWEYATPADIGKAAKDWPQMNFVMYHSCLRPAFELPEQAWTEFEQTGPHRAGSPTWRRSRRSSASPTSMPSSARRSPTRRWRIPSSAPALVGTLIKGMGADHVLWGTDSVWYGSPQWQIEAMRRLEIPEDMQKKYGFAALGRRQRRHQAADLLPATRPGCTTSR